MSNVQYKMQFGWHGDDGAGRALVEQVKRGEKTATSCPEGLLEYGDRQFIERWVGRVIPLVDKHDRHHGEVRLLEVSTSVWGDPDPRLVTGEGHATADEFREAHLEEWTELLGHPPRDTTPLFVELFEFVTAD